MKTLHASLLLTVASLLGSACSSPSDAAPDGTAGANQGGGNAGTTSGSGGASAGSGTTPLAGSGGASGSAGSMSTSGSSAGGQGGTSGAGQAGSAGVGGSGGSGGSGGPATPSAGCAKATGRPQGGTVTVNGDHYFTFPESYDGTKPFPVLWGFHGCGEVNRGTDLNSTEWIRLTDNTAFETEYAETPGHRNTPA